ncbi:hypothetical protein V8J88_04750 [Massilia sp. W12]|uniref:hypothetical protein n=1 Tax=Massilia sp. W12 TaxID=3126507 RepID=UPI0030D44013
MQYFDADSRTGRNHLKELAQPMCYTPGLPLGCAPHTEGGGALYGAWLLAHLGQLLRLR